MKYCWLGCLAFGSLLFAGTQDSDLNVNRRYTVDTVIVAGKGWRSDVSDPRADRLSPTLRRDLLALVGQKLNPGNLDSLASRIRKEFSAREVSHHVLRGETPEHVRVEFEIRPARAAIDANVTKFLYDSHQGWSGVGSVGITVQQQTVMVGLASDGDTLNERYAGINARYENKRVLSDRAGFRFEVESYHEQWNRSTLDALASNPGQTSGAYRSRHTLQPVASFALAKPLTLEVGAGFERFEEQHPVDRTEAANSLMAALRLRERWGQGELRHDVYADYTMRSALRAMGSDYVYTAHTAALHYRAAHGKHQLMEQVVIGSESGRAPLADRFVAGNSTYLRGWNKYEIDPIGGNRLVHNTVEYRYGPYEAFYDAGAVWDSGRPAAVHHSAGIGFKKSILSLAVAFPIRSHHVEPIVMVGMIY
jgi:hypothetical protein